MVYKPTNTGWWFGTWLDDFSIQLGRIIPTDELIFFRGAGQLPNYIPKFRRKFSMELQ